MDTLELLLHPVRLRIVHAMSGWRARTTSDLSAGMPDVPRTTLYRHVAMLAEAGFLEVAGEQRVHGAVERSYRLRRDRPRIGADDAAAMTPEDHRQGFAAAVAALLAEFNAYLDRPDADPTADFVSYRQRPLWLSTEELSGLVADIGSALAPRWNNEAAPGRRPHLLSTILFPMAGSDLDEPGPDR